MTPARRQPRARAHARFHGHRLGIGRPFLLRASESISLLGESGSSSTRYGAVLALAIERELIEALSLRLFVEIARFDRESARIVRTNLTTGEHTTHEIDEIGVGLALRPAIEARFYF